MEQRSSLMAVLLLAAASADAGEPGTAGANFLHIGAGPRAVAMGEAQTAVADDAYAGYWNPAGLSQLRHPEAAVMHNQMGLGIAHQYLAYAHPIGPGHAFGVSVTRLTAGTIDSYDANNTRRGAVEASDLALAASYSHRLRLTANNAPDVRVGVTGRSIRQTLAGTSASTFAGDAGVLVGGFDNMFGEKARGYRFGVAVRNLGPGMRFVLERAPLPRTISTGLAWDGRPWGDPVTFAFDYKVPVDDDPAASFGVEYWARRLVALRMGFVTNQAEGIGLRFGVGIRLKRILVEYALAGFGGLGDMHRFGLSYRFGGALDISERTAQDFVTRGQSFLQQKRYYEAVTEFNQALEIDPGNPAALSSMRAALKGMGKRGAPAPEDDEGEEDADAPR